MAESGQGVELATAYVSLTVSLKGQQREIEKQLAAPIEAAVTKAATNSRKVLDTQLSQGAKAGRASIEQQLDASIAKARQTGAETRASLERAIAQTKVNVGDQIANDVDRGLKKSRVNLSTFGDVAQQTFGSLGGPLGTIGDTVGLARSNMDGLTAATLGLGAAVALQAKLDAALSEEYRGLAVDAETLNKAWQTGDLERYNSELERAAKVAANLDQNTGWIERINTGLKAGLGGLTGGIAGARTAVNAGTDDKTLALANAQLDQYRASLEGLSATDADQAIGLIGYALRAQGFEAETVDKIMANLRAEYVAGKEVATQVAAVHEVVTRMLERERKALNGLTIDYEAGQAAGAAFSKSIDAASNVDDQLAAGLSAGSALKALNKGLLAEANGADKAETASQLAAKALRDLNDQLKLTDPNASRAALRLGALAAGAAGFAKSINDSTGLDDQLTSAVDLGEAFETLHKQARRLPPDFDRNRASLGRYVPEQRTALRAITQLGGATRDYLSTLLQTGESTATVRAEAGRLREEYSAQLRAVGLNEEQVAKYIEVLGLTPKQIETAIKVSGTEAARFKIDTYLSLLEGKIPDEISTSVASAVSAGDLDGAVRILEKFAASNPVRIDVIPEVKPDTKMTLPGVVDPVLASLGGYNESDTLGLQAVQTFADGAREALARFARDHSPQEVIDYADKLRAAFANSLKVNFGLDDAQVQQYIDLVGLSGTQVTTAVTVSGDVEALTKLELLRALVTDENGNGIPKNVDIQIRALLAQDDFAGAEKVLSDYVLAAEARHKIQLTAEVTIGNITTGDGLIITGGLPSNMRGRAAGGPQAAREMGIVGERGPELWWPDAAGTVIPADVTAAIVAGGASARSRSGGGTRIGTVNQYGLKPDEGGRALMLEQRRLERERR